MSVMYSVSTSTSACDFQRPDAVVGAVGVVAAGLITVEAGRFDAAWLVCFSAEAPRNARLVLVGIRANHVRRTV